MPHPPNEGFVGREALRTQIHDALTTGEEGSASRAQVVAIHGMGGVGKTQLAIRYVHDHTDDHDAVFWVLADPPERLSAEYAGLAKVIGLEEASATTDVTEQIQAVRRWLESDDSGRWLLVLDNADEPDVLTGYLPTRGRGRVLITSRRSQWDGDVRAIEVGVMGRAEAVTLLLGRSGSTDEAEADALADALGDFPLALAQAASYIKSTGKGLDEYRKLFTKRHARLLQLGDRPDRYKAESAEAHQGTTFATLDLAMRRLRSPDAETLLGLIACLAPDAIPRDLLVYGFRFETRPPLIVALTLAGWSRLLGRPRDEDQGGTPAGPIVERFDEAIRALGEYSLIKVGGGFVEVHRLVQAVAWERMSRRKRARSLVTTLYLLEAAFPTNIKELGKWDLIDGLLPHASRALELGDTNRVAPWERGLLLDRVGSYHEYKGRYQLAGDCYQRAWTAKLAVRPLPAPNLARSMADQGRVKMLLGDNAGAREPLERALRAFEAGFGPNHPTIAITLMSLAAVAENQGQRGEARGYLERALRIEENGPDRPKVASLLSMLGILASNDGQLDEARDYLGRAYQIVRESYPPGHPEVAKVELSLSRVLYQAGENRLAGMGALRSLLIFRQYLGEDNERTREATELVEQITAKIAQEGLGEEDGDERTPHPDPLPEDQARGQIESDGPSP
jgi:tetratricopeptide (TPR) repeat protein